MNIRTLTAMAALPLTILSAQAGTVVFLVGDPLRPTVGVDGWLTSTMGTITSLDANHTEHPSLPLPDGSVWVESIDGTFQHWHYAPVTWGAPTPEIGTQDASGMTTGSIFWWFEYIPDNPFDTPTEVFYADLQARGQGSIYQFGNSDNMPVTGSSVNLTGSLNGLVTIANGSTVCSPGTTNSQTHYSTGSPWSFFRAETGFTFSQDPVTGRWFGKPVSGNAAATQFGSIIAVSVDARGRTSMSFQRQMKVIKVRSQLGPVWNFNNPWM